MELVKDSSGLFGWLRLVSDTMDYGRAGFALGGEVELTRSFFASEGIEVFGGGWKLIFTAGAKAVV